MATEERDKDKENEEEVTVGDRIRRDLVNEEQDQREEKDRKVKLRDRSLSKKRVSLLKVNRISRRPGKC